MKIKVILTMLTGLILMFSCRETQDREDGGYDPVNNTDTEYSPTESGINRDEESSEQGSEPGSRNSSESENPSNGDERNESTPTENTRDLTGNYIKKGEESDTNCACYCLDVSFSETTELCLVPESMYIDARLERTQDNSINVFLVEPSTRNSGDEDLPWDDFDRNAPIATITTGEGGEMKLDWLGFTINGDLAMDYAIFGKKTLEGDYKRK